MSFMSNLFKKDKEVQLEYRDDEGNVVKKNVDKKWFEEMKQKGLIKEIPTVDVNIIHPLYGVYEDVWRIGEDIPQEMVDKFLDPSTNMIYVCYVFVNGEENKLCVKKELWIQHKKIISNL